MLIQSHYNQQGIFEKIVRSKDGQLVRVCFEVYEFNGEIKGRILKAEPILALARAPQAAVAHFNRLAGNVANACAFLLCAPAKIVSPYFCNIEKKITSPFSSFDLFASIKIRAPSL
jgi:hypothetical protein